MHKKSKKTKRKEAVLKSGVCDAVRGYFLRRLNITIKGFAETSTLPPTHPPLPSPHGTYLAPNINVMLIDLPIHRGDVETSRNKFPCEIGSKVIVSLAVLKDDVPISILRTWIVHCAWTVGKFLIMAILRDGRNCSSNKIDIEHASLSCLCCKEKRI